MIPLPTTFKSDGFNFRQIDRQGKLAIFSKSKDGGAETFEVVIIQKHADYTFPGADKVTPAHEAMPPSNSWGQKGFSMTTLEDARHKLAKLMAEAVTDEDAQN